MADEKKDTTIYLVLEQVETAADGDEPATYLDWREVGEVEVTAGQNRKAIAAAIADRSDEDKAGTFVAVPVRSWRPESPSVKSQLSWT